MYCVTVCHCHRGTQLAVNAKVLLDASDQTITFVTCPNQQSYVFHEVASEVQIATEHHFLALMQLTLTSTQSLRQKYTKSPGRLNEIQNVRAKKLPVLSTVFDN